jgi:hypothetical protein
MKSIRKAQEHSQKVAKQNAVQGHDTNQFQENGITIYPLKILQKATI